MNFKLWIVCFLAVSLLATLTEAGKDRRKKQKQKERAEENEADEETLTGKGLEESGKGRDEKERSSVLEKQSEKKPDEKESSEEDDKDDEDEKNNSTVIIRKLREIRNLRSATFDEGRVLPTDPAKKKRDTTTTQIQKSKEINDGAQLPLDKKPSATASTN